VQDRRWWRAGSARLRPLAGLPYRQPVSITSAVTSARAKCSPAGFESRTASTKSVPVRCRLVAAIPAVGTARVGQ
jgi:hypothetical protein